MPDEGTRVFVVGVPGAQARAARPKGVATLSAWLIWKAPSSNTVVPTVVSNLGIPVKAKEAKMWRG